MGPGFQSEKRLFTIFYFIYAGPMVVDILPKKTGTVLAKVAAAVQSSDQTREPPEDCYSKAILFPTK